MTPLDAAWLLARPLPEHPFGTDKNARGRVLIAGGAELVPGALRLSGEAALRAGAGKLQMATVASAAMALGTTVPEAATIALPADDQGEIAAGAGEILRKAMERCDAFLLGPGMGERECAARIVAETLSAPREGLAIVLDAAAVACAAGFVDKVRAHDGRVVLTPHAGEMAELMGIDPDRVAAEPEETARAAARRFGCVAMLKGGRTIVADPDGGLLGYSGGGVGLATGGSGDVLAGIAAALLARGAAPLVAAGWAVWLHGEAGRALAARIGPIGFLARELLPEIPRLMATAAA